jgi:VIT1/CCC1 family predicted Fe2+/Mn2+ transporter
VSASAPNPSARQDTAEWRVHARESILDVNDGIVSAAGIAEGFAIAGVSTHTLLIAGVTTMLAGGCAAAGARYTEVRTEWEMNRALLAAERASIHADPAGELEELVGLYVAKGLDDGLARQVAQALTAADPVAAHADAELNLAALASTSGAAPAGLVTGLCYAGGAALPLAGILLLPVGERIILTFLAVLIALMLTGRFASWLTGLPALRLIIRNVALGGATMLATLLLGSLINQ